MFVRSFDVCIFKHNYYTEANNFIVEKGEDIKRTEKNNNFKKFLTRNFFIFYFLRGMKYKKMLFCGEGIKELYQPILNYPTGTSDLAYILL